MSPVNHANNNPEMLLSKSFVLGRFQFYCENRCHKDIVNLTRRRQEINLGNERGNPTLLDERMSELQAFYSIGMELINAGINKQKNGRIISLPEFVAFAREYLRQHGGAQQEAFAYLLRNYLADFQGRALAEREASFARLDEGARRARIDEIQSIMEGAVHQLLLD